MDNKEKAKKMFFDYACSTELMDRDGMLHMYRSFGYISKSEEEEWRREFIALWVSKLIPDDCDALGWLRHAWAREALPDLIAMSSRGDSFAKLKYANVIWDLADGDTKEQTEKIAIELVKSIVQHPIELSKEHRTKISSWLKQKGPSTPEEYVLEEARYKLESWSR